LLSKDPDWVIILDESVSTAKRQVIHRAMIALRKIPSRK
jgi:hypothetical protein